MHPLIDSTIHTTPECERKPASQANFDLAGPQVVPSSVHLTEEELLAILNRTASSEIYFIAYGLCIPTPTGATASADVLKIIPSPDPTWPYLGVYHRNDQSGAFRTELAGSADLKTWHAVKTISDASSMPDIRVLPDGSVLYAQERNPSGRRPFIELRYYDHLSTFMSSRPPTQRLSLSFTRGATADGTPAFGRVQYNGNIRTSAIELSHHYFAGGVNDQNAAGTLNGFWEWRDFSSTDLNNEMERLGYEQVGDRELFRLGSTTYELIEGRPSNSAGWDTWRVFLVNKCTGHITKLAPMLAGGARSIGNPRISFISLPNGKDAIATTYFVFSEGAGTTPPGPHLQISVLH